MKKILPYTPIVAIHILFIWFIVSLSSFPTYDTCEIIAKKETVNNSGVPRCFVAVAEREESIAIQWRSYEDYKVGDKILLQNNFYLDKNEKICLAAAGGFLIWFFGTMFLPNSKN